MSERIDRRGFLTTASALGVAGGAAVLGGRPAFATQRSARGPKPARAARNVIFMVSDGMSTGTLTMGSTLRRLRDDRRCHWSMLWDKPGVRRSYCTTHAANSYVTDSAAAASAWGIGEKVNNDAVNFTPDNRAPTPILVHAAQNGLATGLVTTTRVTHATPAGFACNSPKRSFEAAIAAQLLERRIDVILGGGAKHFSQDLLAAHTDSVRATTAVELARAPLAGRLLGLFHANHIPYALGRDPSIPSLKTMTEQALARLAMNDRGFVLQIEAGRVDHAAHDNDAAGMLYDQLEFDDVIGAVMQWIGDRDDTLLIVTSDHGNANPGHTAYGPAGKEAFATLLKATRSFEWIYDKLEASGPVDDPDNVSERLPALASEAAGFEVTRTDVEPVVRVLRGERVMPYEPLNKPFNVLGAVLANRYHVGFMSPNHTSDAVELTSYGPGSELLGNQADNTDLHRVVASALALAPAKPVEVGTMSGPAPKPD